MPFGIMGTPSYMSPEQLKEEQLSPSSDVFSLGCVLYELLKGQQAFTGENLYSIIYKIVNVDPEPVSNFRQIPIILEKIINKAIAKDSSQRYASCREFADELRIALRGIPGVSHETKVEGLIDYIHHLDFFKEFPKKQIVGLITASKIVKISKGHIILSEGEISDTFYIILKGRAKVIKEGQDIAFIGAGECFGEMACLGYQPRVANVIAAQECVLMKFWMNNLDETDESTQLQFYKTFSTILVRRLSQSSQNKQMEKPGFSHRIRKAG
jgi:serine/threonine-protein kinase